MQQEVEKVLPEIVETRDNGYKAVKYEKIVALLIESNKELIKRVEELEEKSNDKLKDLIKEERERETFMEILTSKAKIKELPSHLLSLILTMSVQIS